MINTNDLINMGLALVEGFALIASPCILPVLPFLLSGSVDGDKKRPYGIILGLVFSFTAFALLLRKFVNLLGLDLEIIRNVSLGLLTLFGLILLSGKQSEIFNQKYSIRTLRSLPIMLPNLVLLRVKEMVLQVVFYLDA